MYNKQIKTFKTTLFNLVENNTLKNIVKSQISQINTKTKFLKFDQTFRSILCLLCFYIQGKEKN